MEVFFHYFSKEFSKFLLFLFSFWHPYDANVGPLQVVKQAASTALIFWILLFLVLIWLFFPPLRSKPLIQFLVSSDLLLLPCKLFCISNSVAFISDWIFFMLLRSSLSSSSILMGRSLKSASHRLIICILFVVFLEFWSVFFIWAMFPCVLILAVSLSLFLHMW